LERERAVRPVSVVMGGVGAEHLLEVAAVDDQDPVEALAAEGADPTLGVRIRIRSSMGVRMILMPSLRKTSSKAPPNLLSRS
jgi:hypothetical protein